MTRAIHELLAIEPTDTADLSLHLAAVRRVIERVLPPDERLELLAWLDDLMPPAIH